MLLFVNLSFENTYVGEIAEFFGCRVATGLLDVGIMLVAVDLLGWNSLLWKVLSNGVVTVTNYAVSHFRIFTEK